MKRERKARAASRPLTRAPSLGEATDAEKAALRPAGPNGALNGVVITPREAARRAIWRAAPTAAAALAGGVAAQALLGPGGLLAVAVTGAGGLALAVAAERALKLRVRVGPRLLTEAALSFAGGVVVILLARWLA